MDVSEIVEVELEEAVLGSILVSPSLLDVILENTKLTPRAFAIEENKAVYELMTKLHDKGTPASTELVVANLNGFPSKDYVYNLAHSTAAPGNAPHYAKRLVEVSAWRFRRQAAIRQLEAINKRDLSSYSRARSLSDTEDLSATAMKDPTQLAEGFRSYINSYNSEVIKLPFDKLNRCLAGGFRRKQMTILGGWSGHGKSLWIDQMLEKFSMDGFSTHLYINEMSNEERVGRLVTRATGIAYEKVLTGQMSMEEQQAVDAALEGLAFPITDCTGWSIDELIFDVKRQRFDVIGVDILHQFDYDSESELARISRFLKRTANLANCHVIATVHLNEARATDSKRPRPVTRDIRGTGMIKNDADNVMMLYREQDPTTGDPIHSTSIYLCKVRNGTTGAQYCVLDDRHLRFTEMDDSRVWDFC